MDVVAAPECLRGGDAYMLGLFLEQVSQVCIFSLQGRSVTEHMRLNICTQHTTVGVLFRIEVTGAIMISV